MGSRDSAVRIIGRYAIFGEIAAGGMATVHFGRLIGPVGFSRTVAIKRLHAQFAKDPDFVSMFLDEARLAARIQHPNVVSIVDVVTTEGELFLVMDYVHGETLSKLVRASAAKGGRMPPRIVAAIAANLLHGLHAAHEIKDDRGELLDLVHRDVSPQNILIGADGVARVVDFGVAMAAGRVQTTREGQTKGKFAYMAPEQLQGEAVTRRTDIYAASIVIWEALTGERLFSGDNEGALVMNALMGTKRRASSIVPGISPELDEIILKGLSRTPEKRFQTARDMAMAIEERVEIARPSEVGAYLEQMMGAVLQQREQRRLVMERDTTLVMQHPQHSQVNLTQSQEGRLYAGPLTTQLPTMPTAPTTPSDVPTLAAAATTTGEYEAASARVVAELPPKRRWQVISAVMLTGAVILLVGFIRSMGVKEEPGKGERTVNGASPPPISVVAPIPEPGPPLAIADLDSLDVGEKNDAGAGASQATADQTKKFVPGPVKPRVEPKVTPPQAAKDTKPDCNPPYRVDSSGRKIFKLECL